MDEPVTVIKQSDPNESLQDDQVKQEVVVEELHETVDNYDDKFPSPDLARRDCSTPKLTREDDHDLSDQQEDFVILGKESEAENEESFVTLEQSEEVPEVTSEIRHMQTSNLQAFTSKLEAEVQDNNGDIENALETKEDIAEDFEKEKENVANVSTDSNLLVYDESVVSGIPVVVDDSVKVSANAVIVENDSLESVKDDEPMKTEEIIEEVYNDIKSFSEKHEDQKHEQSSLINLEPQEKQAPVDEVLEEPSETEQNKIESTEKEVHPVDITAPLVFHPNQTSVHVISTDIPIDQITDLNSKTPNTKHKPVLVGPQPYFKPSGSFQSSSSADTTPDEEHKELRFPKSANLSSRPVPKPRTIHKTNSPSPTNDSGRRLQFSEAKSKSSSEIKGSKRTRLSTMSLHTSSLEEEKSAPMNEEDQPLQRRNSIHNVPFVDVNDPQTRERMERYKEERRSLLRAKYKVEDYVTKKENTESNSAIPKVTLRKMNVDSSPVMKKTSVGEIYKPKVGESSRKWSLPDKKLDEEKKNLKTSTTVIPKPRERSAKLNLTQSMPKPLSPHPERPRGGTPNRTSFPPGPKKVEEDVNVRERAAKFGTSTVKPELDANKRTRTIKMGSDLATKNRGDTPGSPSKIKNMAAFFEQKA